MAFRLILIVTVYLICTEANAVLTEKSFSGLVKNIKHQSIKTNLLDACRV